jgi:hypothetical protein
MKPVLSIPLAREACLFRCVKIIEARQYALRKTYRAMQSSSALRCAAGMESCGVPGRMASTVRRRWFNDASHQVWMQRYMGHMLLEHTRDDRHAAQHAKASPHHKVVTQGRGEVRTQSLLPCLATPALGSTSQHRIRQQKTDISFDYKSPSVTSRLTIHLQLW